LLAACDPLPTDWTPKGEMACCDIPAVASTKARFSMASAVSAAANDCCTLSASRCLE
jgi:hypothetical protein